MKRISNKGKNSIKHGKKRKLKSKFLIIIPFLIFLLVFLFIINLFYINKQEKKMKTIANDYFSKNKIEKEIGSLKNQYKFNLSKSYYIRYPSFKYDNINNNIDKVISELKDNAKNNIGDIIKNKHIYNITDYESYLAPDGIVGIAFINVKINNKGKVISKSVNTINISKSENNTLTDNYIFVGNYKDTITNYIDNYINSDEKLKKNLKKDYKSIVSNDNNYKYILTKDSVNVYFNSCELLKNSKDIIKITIPYKDIENILNIDTNNIVSLKDVKDIKEVFKDNSKAMYVKRLSNIYSKASKNSKLLSTIDKGSKVDVIKSSENYSVIKYKDKKGYILNKYLSDDIVADSGYIDVSETVYASEDVIIKKGIEDEAEELVKLAFGDSITRIGTSDNGYSEVVYNNEKGFVKSSYLSLVKPVINRYIKIDKSKNINVHGGMVALTFDDGPNPSSTGRILNALEKNHAVATFFDLGNLVNSYPDVVKREESIGCEVASHSYNHPNLNNLGKEAIQEQINNSRNAFVNVLGHDVSLFRPPYGNANALVKENVPYPLINWNVDTLDWKSKNKDAILNEVRKIGNLDGKIILMHSIHETTADAVEVLVPELISQGYQLVTVSELAYYKGVALNPGETYYGF